ncbi:MAG: DUF456 domain-containing protein [Calditrichales bacterium]|nr:MAG: DUF456 domain-containing protein [Calditrichales bacterium]
MDFVSIILMVLAWLIVVGGVVGLVLPILPGPLLILAGLFMAAWVERFLYVGSGTITILVLLTVAAFGLDFLAGAFGAKRFGGNQRAVAGATIGALGGLFFGVIGVFLGPFIGAIIGQISTRDSFKNAGKAGIGVWLGLALGTAAKVSIGFAMIGIYLVVRLF